MEYTTEQEKFWAGKFGDEYTDRNLKEFPGWSGTNIGASNLALFSQVLRSAGKVKSGIEFGANRGLNLRALRTLLPEIHLTGVEINKYAAEEMGRIGDVDVRNCSMLDFVPDYQRELSFTQGVLIHLNPERLPDAYRVLYESSTRLICVTEYYSAHPAEITYRGHGERMFKRDFAGEMLQTYPDLRLLDYGFAYHGDPKWPQDDLNWFLMEKM